MMDKFKTYQLECEVRLMTETPEQVIESLLKMLVERDNRIEELEAQLIDSAVEITSGNGVTPVVSSPWRGGGCHL